RRSDAAMLVPDERRASRRLRAAQKRAAHPGCEALALLQRQHHVEARLQFVPGLRDLHQQFAAEEFVEAVERFAREIELGGEHWPRRRLHFEMECPGAPRLRG